MVDRLANEYAAAGKPVVFLEQNYQQDTTPKWFGALRINRLQAATNFSAYPGVMLDSGNRVTTGNQDGYYYRNYKALVDAELARPPQAVISATFWRVGNHLEFDVRFKNLSGVTLSQAANDATVGVIVYEDVVPGPEISDTSRIDRAVLHKSIITDLAHDASSTEQLQTADLIGVNWSKLHSVAFVEYRPGGTSDAYNMLQAAMAVNDPFFTVQPNNLTFQVDQANPGGPQAVLQPAGLPSSLVWTVASKPAWLTVTPESGGPGDPALIRVNVSSLQPGANDGDIRFNASAPGLSFTQDVSVHVTFTPGFTVQPATLDITIGPDDLTDREVTLWISGCPPALTWTVTSKPDWLNVTPGTGEIEGYPLVHINAGGLKPGANDGTIRFSASEYGLTFTQDVGVHVTYNPPPPSLTLLPDAIKVLIDIGETDDPEVPLAVSGYPPDLTWTVTSKPAWVTLTPDTGVVGDSLLARIDTSALLPGNNTGIIRFNAVVEGVTLTTDVAVDAFYADLLYYHIPLVTYTDMRVYYIPLITR